jgi:hypothetical protein
MKDWRCFLGFHDWGYEFSERNKRLNEKGDTQFPADGRHCLRCPRRERRVFGMTEDWWEKAR